MACNNNDTAISDAVPGRLKQNFCQPCSRKSANNVAAIYCEDCKEYQCKQCSEGHEVYSVMSKHKWINANEASVMLPKYDMKGHDQCQEHSRILEFFCEDDNKLCCSTCAILNHRKCHTVIQISRKANESVDEITNLKQKFLQVIVDADSVLQRIEKSREIVKANSAKITEQIKDMQDDVNEMFENLKRTVRKELGSFQLRTFDDFVMTQTLCTSLITYVSQALSEIEDVSEHGTFDQQFIIAQRLAGEVTKLENEVMRIYGSLNDVFLEFEFAQSLQLPPAKNFMPGKLTSTYKILGEIINKEDESGPISDSEDGNISTEENFNTECQISTKYDDSRSFQVKSNAKQTYVRPTKGSIASDYDGKSYFKEPQAKNSYGKKGSKASEYYGKSYYKEPQAENSDDKKSSKASEYYGKSYYKEPQAENPYGKKSSKASEYDGKSYYKEPYGENPHGKKGSKASEYDGKSYYKEPRADNPYGKKGTKASEYDGKSYFKVVEKFYGKKGSKASEYDGESYNKEPRAENPYGKKSSKASEYYGKSCDKEPHAENPYCKKGDKASEYDS